MHFTIENAHQEYLFCQHIKIEGTEDSIVVSKKRQIPGYGEVPPEPEVLFMFFGCHITGNTAATMRNIAAALEYAADLTETLTEPLIEGTLP